MMIRQLAPSIRVAGMGQVLSGPVLLAKLLLRESESLLRRWMPNSSNLFLVTEVVQV